MIMKNCSINSDLMEFFTAILAHCKLKIFAWAVATFFFSMLFPFWWRIMTSTSLVWRDILNVSYIIAVNSLLNSCLLFSIPSLYEKVKNWLTIFFIISLFLIIPTALYIGAHTTTDSVTSIILSVLLLFCTSILFLIHSYLSIDEKVLERLSNENNQFGNIPALNSTTNGGRRA